jgi:hypothetical protein
MSKAREPVKNQSFCNWFLFFHIFLRDVVMYKSQSSLSFFLSLVHASKQASKQTNKQQDLLLPLGGGVARGGVIAMWDLEAPP